MTDKETVDHWFTYHPPRNATEIDKYTKIREAARVFGQVLLENTPGSADQTAAFRKLRECVATANASIALEGK